ncbi:MAG: hypothetical protein EP315_04190 [Gammaproteobacteria bacterium]|nr:MAG: hypothetical protein EP315_04190 [Gammaproteobacteria bacterium]
MKFRGPPENWEKGIDINRAAVEKNNQLYTRTNSVYGLSRYAGAGHLNDKYFSNERQLEITCDSVDDGLFSPSCHSKSKYIYGIDFEYYYGLNHLPRWREIDDGMKSMFNQFLKAE